MTGTSSPFQVLIAGGGLAGLEAALALRDLLGDRVELTMVAPEREFVYRPMAVASPFGRGQAQRHELAEIAGQLGVRLRHDRLERVADAGRSAATAGGERLAYDALVIAIGAASELVFRQGTTWTPEADAEIYAGLLADLEEGCSKRVGFVIPIGVYWPLPGYERALMTAWDARDMGQDDVDIVVYTHERSPLEIFSATALALLGLRAMYFLLAGMRDRFVYLDVGLAVILIFIGAKFMLTEVVEIGVAVSLLVIVGVRTFAIVASLLRDVSRRE